MWSIGPIGFAAPLLLLGLIALPILWFLLRAVPPAPIRRRFPAVSLLLGLSDDEVQSDRTPWWLLLLRMLAIAAAIIGFAGPVLNPQSTERGSGPLLIIADGTWADARDWPARTERIASLLSEASRNGRTVALTTLTDLPATQAFRSADAVSQSLPNLQPNPWEPQIEDLQNWLAQLPEAFETYWLSDGLERADRIDLLQALQERGGVTVFQTPRQTFGLRPPRFEDGEIIVSAARTPIGNETAVEINAVGLDPAGVERQLATVELDFPAGDRVSETRIVLPPELRNRITRFEISGVRSAGAVSLTDDALKRREVALLSGAGDQEGLDLLDPLFYLREALEPTADLIDGTLTDMLLANPDAIILADVATLADNETSGLLEWVEQGGLLVRFAGPRLASSEIGRTDEDPLLPVRLRQGGRSIGGTMSWGEPKTLAAFPDGSPFFGLTVPADVEVTAQVVAQPDPSLASRVIAQLADGTPMVTRKDVGEGQVILFHVTANAEWSSLPLSGLFVEMLERLAISTRPAQAATGDLAGTTWLPEDLLNAFGRLEDGRTLAGIDGALLEDPVPSGDLRPGLYAGNDRRIAVNVIGPETTLATAQWPSDVSLEGLAVAEETDLKGWLLVAALTALAIDALASLAIGGRLKGPRADVALVLALTVLLSPTVADAQNDDLALYATSNVVLGYVITGDAQTDEISEAGLRGLGSTLFRRTTIEPSEPIGVNLETDELAFFPFLYWPITPNQSLPSRRLTAKSTVTCGPAV